MFVFASAIFRGTRDKIFSMARRETKLLPQILGGNGFPRSVKSF